MTAELEAAIDAHPDEAASYRVLGDYLLERGDRRGELIALHGKPGAIALQRELGPAPISPHGRVDWFYGFVRAVEAYVDADDAAAVRAYLAHPSLRFVQALTFRLAGSADDDRQWLVDALVPAPALRSLTIDSYLRGGNEPACGELTIGALPTPRLRTLELRARYLAIAAPLPPALRTLVLDGGVLADELAPRLAELPALETLTASDVDRPAALRHPTARLAVATAPADRYDQVGE